jgi:ribosomal protein S12
MKHWPARIHQNRKKLLSGRRPLRRAIVAKAVLKDPKKPHSAKRATVKFYVQRNRKLTNYAYIPAEDGRRRLKRFDVIFFRGGRRRDIPAMKYVAVYGVRTKGQKTTTLRGLTGQRKKSRSKYAARLRGAV